MTASLTVPCKYCGLWVYCSVLTLHRQEQRVFSVYADAQLYKDLWWNYRVWLQQYRDIDGFYGLHCNMPITPRQVSQGVLRGGNALGLEGVGNKTLGSVFLFLTNQRKA